MKATKMLIAASFVALAGVAAVPTGAAETTCDGRPENLPPEGYDTWASGWAIDCSGKMHTIFLECQAEFQTDVEDVAQCFDARSGLELVPN